MLLCVNMDALQTTQRLLRCQFKTLRNPEAMYLLDKMKSQTHPGFHSLKGDTMSIQL